MTDFLAYLESCRWEAVPVHEDDGPEKSIIVAVPNGEYPQRVQWFGGGHYLVEPYYN